MIYELRNDRINEFATLVLTNPDPFAWKTVACDGMKKNWETPLSVMISPEPRRKKPKPRANFSLLGLGAFTLDQKAKFVLGDFLARFGQFLEVNCQDEIEHYYNVTTLMNAIDKDLSDFDKNGVVQKAVFLPNIDGDEPLIFKDALTASSRIYINETGRKILEKYFSENSLTGLKFSIPHSTPY